MQIFSFNISSSSKKKFILIHLYTLKKKVIQKKKITIKFLSIN